MNIRKDSLSLTSWLTSFTVTGYQKCRWSAFHGLLRATTAVTEKQVRHAAGWRWIMTWRGCSDWLQRHRLEITSTFWQHFFTRHWGAGMGAHELAHAQAHTEQTTGKHGSSRQSFPFGSASSLCLNFFPLPSCFHRQTHSRSGGVIECDSESWEGCWQVTRLTYEM